MKTPQEIENLLTKFLEKDFYGRKIKDIDFDDCSKLELEAVKIGFTKGYTKHQQDNADKNRKEISLIEKKEFPHHIAVQIKGLTILKLIARGSGWELVTLDMIERFWVGGTIKQFATLEEAKEGAIKWAENWLNR